ncbi:hypothetical protein AGLY_009325 [Aphis glycines]|uniref:DUF659 domain-containing protein n=1 Tax=Aphis glycines TaxID=307491 RepID=A0A6G0TIG4_APHGL|nr:hypothetical protein AGLY_009325 [Aphis glycines]
MLESDIHLWKLNHPSFKSFLEKYIEKSVPDQSTTYGDGLIWFLLHKTTDIDGWFVCSVIIGLLHDEYYSEPWLLMSEEIFKYNFQIVGKLFNDAMQLLWPSGVKYENVLLFVTDAVPYMVKAADSLTVLFLNLIHLIFLTHGIHRVCEIIRVRAEYTTVDKMIANVKKIFLKAPSRTLKLSEMFPNLPLPLKPVLTRWATWLTAVTNRLLVCNGRVADKVKNKLSLILQKYKGFKTLQSINKILNGESDEDNFSCNLTPGQITLLKYAPTISCDVERSFSQYKAIIRSNRRSFTNSQSYIPISLHNLYKSVDSIEQSLEPSIFSSSTIVYESNQNWINFANKQLMNKVH